MKMDKYIFQHETTQENKSNIILFILTCDLLTSMVQVIKGKVILKITSRDTKAAFTWQTKVGKLVLADSSWCVQTAQTVHKQVGKQLVTNHVICVALESQNRGIFQRGLILSGFEGRFIYSLQRHYKQTKENGGDSRQTGF